MDPWIDIYDVVPIFDTKINKYFGIHDTKLKSNYKF